MNPIPDDELLSAYLDGELSEADRARAEQLLAEQPEARQLLEDLRALHGGFEGLPVHRLDQDFPARVLRGAEREMLAAEPPAESLTADQAAPGGKPLAAASPHSGPQHSAPALQPSFGWARWRRPVAWAGLAMAAGLLLMVFDRNLHPPAGQGQVAHAPSAGSEMRAASEPEPAPAGNEKLFAHNPSSAKANRDELSGGERRLNWDANRDAIREADDALADGPAEPGRRAAGRPESAAASSAPKAAAGMSPAGGDDARFGGRKSGADARSIPAKQAESIRLRQRGAIRNEDQSSELFLYDVELQQNGQLVSEPLDENTLIVWCDVDANVDVADQPEFQQMLAGNKIAWEPDLAIGPAGKAAASEKAPASELKSLNSPNKSAESLNKSTDESVDKKSQVAGGGGASVKQKSADRQERLRSLAEQPVRMGRQESLDRAQVVAETLSENNADYILVEATEEQLKAVLTEIDRHPEMFLSVNVEPAAEVPAQQAYRSYNRGRAGPPLAKGRFSQETRKSALKETRTADAAAPAAKDAAQPAGDRGSQQLGRAQRVMVLQQSPKMLEESAERMIGDLSGLELPKAEAHAKSLSGKARGKQSLLGLESDVAAKDAPSAKPAAAAPPAAVPAKPDAKEARPSESKADDAAPQNYQQALFIFRRVSPASPPAEPAEAGKKPQ